jgi:hypothetical protein
MKKLHKLEINPNKIINNEELITLRGGEGGTTCVKCYAEGWGSGCMGFLGTFYTTCSAADEYGAELCHDLYGGWCEEHSCDVNCD